MGIVPTFCAPKAVNKEFHIFFQLVLKGLPLHMQTGCALGYVPPGSGLWCVSVSSSMRSI